MSCIVYGGLDVHQEFITVYLFCPDTGEIVEDQIPNTQSAVVRAVRLWKKMGELRLCYEASGAGFVLKRWLDTLGVQCDVIAPSLVPKAPGNRVKTDRRDAKRLAQLYRAGLLTPVRVPDTTEETARALVRLRSEVTADSVRVKNRVRSYLRSLGYSTGQRQTGSAKFRLWVASLPLDPTQRFIVDTHLTSLESIHAQREEIDHQITQLAESERYRDSVQRLLSLKGIKMYSAMVLLTEIGDARRFATPSQLMSYLGLVPREHSSGGQRHTGAITKTGNTHGRWILIEAGWNQMSKPGCGRIRTHWRTQPAAVVDIARKAELRLHHKFWRVAQRKDRNTAVTAVAREMVGFVWALLTMQAA